MLFWYGLYVVFCWHSAACSFPFSLNFFYWIPTEFISPCSANDMVKLRRLHHHVNFFWSPCCKIFITIIFIAVASAEKVCRAAKSFSFIKTVMLWMPKYYACLSYTSWLPFQANILAINWFRWREMLMKVHGGCWTIVFISKFVACIRIRSFWVSRRWCREKRW